MLSREKLKVIKRDIDKNGKAQYPMLHLSTEEVAQLNNLGYEVAYVEITSESLFYDFRYTQMCPEISKKEN